jgi:hypothetical protein
LDLSLRQLVQASALLAELDASTRSPLVGRVEFKSPLMIATTKKAKPVVTSSPAKEKTTKKERKKTEKTKQPHINVYWVCFLIACFCFWFCVFLLFQNSRLFFLILCLLFFKQWFVCFFCIGLRFFLEP